MHALFITAHNIKGILVYININNINSFNALSTPTLSGGQTVIYCDGPIIVTESVETIQQRIEAAISRNINWWKD